jgi:anthranilate phosphoribosyltransferase
MKHLMPIRKSIEYRTIFNILGPLTNPAGVKKYLLGVFSPDYVERMAKALLDLDVRRAYVVSSHDGMDEISLSSMTSFAYVESDRISEAVIDPEIYGFKLAPKEAILGGDAEDNAEIIRSIFTGEEQGAKRDIVILNAMFALFVDGKVRDLQEAKQMAAAALDSGKAMEHLHTIAKVSNSF